MIITMPPEQLYKCLHHSIDIIIAVFVVREENSALFDNEYENIESVNDCDQYDVNYSLINNPI